MELFLVMKLKSNILKIFKTYKGTYFYCLLIILRY